jgi:hypothetical protein
MGYFFEYNFSVIIVFSNYFRIELIVLIFIQILSFYTPYLTNIYNVIEFLSYRIQLWFIDGFVGSTVKIWLTEWRYLIAMVIIYCCSLRRRNWSIFECVMIRIKCYYYILSISGYILNEIINWRVWEENFSSHWLIEPSRCHNTV